MILFEVILASLLLSLLAGGSLRHLQDEPLTGEWALLLLLPVQMLWPGASQRLGLGCSLSMIVWLLLMASLAVVLMLNAPRRWMLAFAALGIAANILVIGVNGAMPVSLKAGSEIGGTRVAVRADLGEECLHEAMDEATRLPFLADVIAIPGPVWQRGVLSVGDLLLVLGLGAWVFAASRRPPTRSRHDEDSMH
ncbi:MAG: DUF5317 family protein [Coriobacteriia bacterium]|nr:DUF5317 family protein [Coriobacteriia bacterium]